MEEHVSPVIRRSLLNVTGDLKKAIRFEDPFLKILEFFVSRSDIVNSKFGQKNWNPYYCMSIVIKRIEVNNKSLHNKIVKREKFLDTFPHIS